MPIEGKYVLDCFSLMVEDNALPTKSSATHINILKSWFEVRGQYTKESTDVESVGI
jgi:hypothetical protein